MPLRIGVHLCFAGECQAAFEHYQRIFGGTIVTLLRYGESPMAGQVSAHWQDRIQHATLELEGMELTGVDVFPDAYQKPQGFFVTLAVPEVEDARRIFLALSEGGVVGLPFQATFWSAGFGVLVDRYSVPWEINSAQQWRERIMLMFFFWCLPLALLRETLLLPARVLGGLSGSAGRQEIQFDNKVVHFSRWESIARARAFFESPRLSEIRRQAGVEAPEFIYLQELEAGTL